jgi:acetyl esterase/lipase
MGDSSGGWLAAMAALTGDVLDLEGTVGVTGPPSRVQAAVDLYGPTEFLSMNGQMLPGACEAFNAAYGLRECHDDPGSPESRLLGVPIRERPDLVERASPLTYATPTAPPMMVLHGQRDLLVPEAQSRLLHAALRRAWAPVTFVSVADAGHAWPQVLAGGRLAEVAAFLDAALGHRPPSPPGKVTARRR